jgi:hypothetical protein
MRSRIVHGLAAEFLRPYSSMSRLEPENRGCSLNGLYELDRNFLMPQVQLMPSLATWLQAEFALL